MAKLNPDNIRSIERVIGRPLRPHEVESGKVDPKPQTLEEQRDAKLKAIEAANFRPVLANAADKPAELYKKFLHLISEGKTEEALVVKREREILLREQVLAISEGEAMAEQEKERFASASPAEKRTILVQRDKAKLEAEKAAATAKAEHLKSVGPTINRLTALREELDQEPTLDESDLFVIDKAILQLQTVGGDPAVTAKLVAGADTLAATVRKSKGDAISARLQSLEADRVALAAELQRLTGKPEKQKAEDEDYAVKAHTAEYDAKPSTVAWKKWKALSTSGTAKPDEIDKAGRDWLAAEKADRIAAEKAAQGGAA